MPADQPDHLPADMDELDAMIARAYAQGIESGKIAGRLDTLEKIRAFFRKEFAISKGMRRLADPDDPKTAAVLAFWEKFNEKVEGGSL